MIVSLMVIPSPVRCFNWRIFCFFQIPTLTDVVCIWPVSLIFLATQDFVLTLPFFVLVWSCHI